MSKALDNNNPGNLKYIGQTGATNNQGFAKFESPDDGYVALMNDLQSKIKGSTSTGLSATSTLSDFSKVYAPPHENDTDGYTLKLANQLKTPPDTKLADLESRVPEFAQAIAQNEDGEFVKKYPINIPQTNVPPQNVGQENLPTGTPAPVEFKPTYPTSEQKSEKQGLLAKGGLGESLVNRSKDASTAISEAMEGKINPFSGAIQTVGALAGGAGDIVSALIKSTPVVGTVVKNIEDSLGEQATSFFNSDTGKGVLISISNFTKEHPELSKDIGAGINIISAFPILKGLGVGVNIGKDIASMTLKSMAEKAAVEGLSSARLLGKNGSKYLSRNPNAAATLVSERALPEIVDGKYVTSAAKSKLDDAIEEIDDELQAVLDKASTEKISQRVPLENLKNQAMAEAIENLESPDAVENAFKLIQKKYGDYPTIAQMNEAKRIISRRITEKGFTSPTYDVDKVLRSTFQKGVEEGAIAAGLPDVAEINGRMAKLIKAQGLLKYIDNSNVKTGSIANAVQTSATVAGEGIGSFLGVPTGIGGYSANKLSGMLGKTFTGAPLGVLSRTGKDASRTSLKEAFGGVKNLTKGLIGQKIAEPKRD